MFGTEYEDDHSLVPTVLDLNRMDDLEAGEKMESENGAFTVYRYKPCLAWLPFVLICQLRRFDYETLEGLKKHLQRLESARNLVKK